MSSVPSYRHLAATYDLLFPLDPQALAFVEVALGKISGQKVVDAGCGTGLLAQALGHRGGKVFAFDLDDDLLAQALVRSSPSVQFAKGDLRSWVLPTGFSRADGVLCFGNTLPHLTLVNEVDEFFSRTVRALSPGGKLLIQVLDYDFIEKSGTFELPRRDGDGWTFQRHYVVQSNGLWTFHTSLSSSGGQSSNAFELCPWRRHELETALKRAGFLIDGVFGGFDRRPPGNSLPLVLQARLA